MSPRTRNIIIAVVAAVLLVTVVGPFVYINFIKDDPPERLTPRRRHHHDRRRRRHRHHRRRGRRHRGHLGGGRRQHRGLPDRRDAVRSGLRGGRPIGGRHRRGHHRGHHGHRRDASRWTWPPSRAASPSATASSRTASWRSREFPTATFVLTEPIELGAVPADGEEVTATATGDLTLHGVTREVTIDLVARLDGSHLRGRRHHHRHVLRLRRSTTRAAARPRWATRASSRCSWSSAGSGRSASLGGGREGGRRQHVEHGVALQRAATRAERPTGAAQRVQRDRGDGERRRSAGRRATGRPSRPTATPSVAARATSPPSCSALAQRPPGPWYATLPSPSTAVATATAVHAGCRRRRAARAIGTRGGDERQAADGVGRLADQARADLLAVALGDVSSGGHGGPATWRTVSTTSARTASARPTVPMRSRCACHRSSIHARARARSTIQTAARAPTAAVSDDQQALERPVGRQHPGGDPRGGERDEAHEHARGALRHRRLHEQADEDDEQRRATRSPARWRRRARPGATTSTAIQNAERSRRAGLVGRMTSASVRRRPARVVR